MRVPEAARRETRRRAGGRCEYCRHGERLIGLAHEIDHVVPRARGGTNDLENLCLACSACNSSKGIRTSGQDRAKGEEVALFNPRHQRWDEHFRWTDDGRRIEGLTPCGRATVDMLDMNHPLAVAVRTVWVDIGLHPPDGSGASEPHLSS